MSPQSTTSFHAQSDVHRLTRRFLPYLRPIARQASITTFLVLAAPLVSVALIWMAKEITDEVLLAGRMDLLPAFAAGLIGITAVKIVLSYAATRLEAGVVESIVQALRVDLYRHLLSLSPGSLRKRSVGDQLAHLSTDVERTELLIFTGLLSVAADLAGVLFFTAFLMILSWKLTACAVVALPLMLVASARLSPRVRRASRVSRHRATAVLALAEERLGASLMIQAAGAQPVEVAAFAERCATSRRAELRAVSVQAWLTLVIEAAVALGGLLVLAAGAHEIAHGALTFGALVAFIGSVGSLYDPARGLARAAARFQRAAAGAQRVADLLDTPSLVPERRGLPATRSVGGRLEFRNVFFAYPSGATALHDVSLAVEPGETVAVVGSSGAGKSSLVLLALGLYAPSSGSVLLDGSDLRDLSSDSIRRAMSVVFQQPFLFRGTVADNIRYGRPEASDERVAAMAKAAHVSVGARGGLLVPVGPRGDWLSAGQRQRVALARALMREAPILILDEATASVDSETEELIQDAVERLSGQRTLLVVAHRLSTVRRADRIIVLDRGRVVETGSPDALLARRSRCRQLFEAQLHQERAAA
jgi:ATP-binding cassette, subfamily B, bacterial